MRFAFYNPMTGQRTDLEVTKADGAAADAQHAGWKAKRIAYLETLIAGSDGATRAIYERELANTRAGEGDA